MSDTEAIVLLDCGTSGVKSSLLPRPGNTAEVPKLLKTKKIENNAADGATGLKRVWQPALLLKQVIQALLHESQRAKQQKLKIVGAGITSTTSSTVTLKGQCILPMPPPLRWDDQQSRKEAERLEEIRSKTQSMPWMEPIMPDSGISKAVWLISNYPKDFTSTGSRTVEQWTFLNWFLTEKIVQCETILGRKWGHTSSRPLPEEFKRRLGMLLKQETLPDKGPDEAYDEFGNHVFCGDLKSAGDEIGYMTWRLAEALSLQTQPKVFAVPHDTFAQIIGMGMVEAGDSIGITFGTSQGICAVINDKTSTGSDLIPSIPDAPVHGTSVVYDGIASCGGAITFVCENHGFVDQNGRVNTNEVEACLRKTAPGAEGIMMLPYYNGGRRVSHGARVDGIIVGLNQGKDRANIIRALFESIAFITRGIINDFEQMTGRKFRQVLASGGPARSDLFIRILASILDRDVVLFEEEEADASLVGCAICAAKGLSWYRSLPEACEKLVKKKAPVNPNPTQVKEYNSLYKEYYKRFSKDIPLISNT